MTDLIDPFFNEEQFTRPATFVEDYTADVPVEHEISVIFDRDENDSFGTQNAAPVALAKTLDLVNIGTKSQLIVHYGYLQDERGRDILTESGDRIIAENEFTYYVAKHFPDPFGMTRMELTLNPPN